MLAQQPFERSSPAFPTYSPAVGQSVAYTGYSPAQQGPTYIHSAQSTPASPFETFRPQGPTTAQSSFQSNVLPTQLTSQVQPQSNFGNFQQVAPAQPQGHGFAGTTLVQPAPQLFQQTTFGTPATRSFQFNEAGPSLPPVAEEAYPTKWHKSTRLRSDVRPRMKRQKPGACGNVNSTVCGVCDSVGCCGCLNCGGCCDRDVVVPHAIVHPVLKEKRGVC